MSDTQTDLTPIQEMDRAVVCLALELPDSVHEDVTKRWQAVKDFVWQGGFEYREASDRADENGDRAEVAMACIRRLSGHGYAGAWTFAGAHWVRYDRGGAAFAWEDVTEAELAVMREIIGG